MDVVSVLVRRCRTFLHLTNKNKKLFQIFLFSLKATLISNLNYRLYVCMYVHTKFSCFHIHNNNNNKILHLVLCFYSPKMQDGLHFITMAEISTWKGCFIGGFYYPMPSPENQFYEYAIFSGTYLHRCEALENKPQAHKLPCKV